MVDIKYDVIEENFIPTAQAREILDAVEEKTYEQKVALEHAKKFGKLKIDEAEKIFKALAGLDMRKLKPEQIVKIIDLMPEDVEDLKVILSTSDVSFKDEELVKIIEILKSTK